MKSAHPLDAASVSQRSLARFFTLAGLAILLVAGNALGQTQYVTKSGTHFMYRGNPITFYGCSFDPAAEGFTSAWHSSNFTTTIHRDITNAIAAGQNIMRPTDYWDSSTAGQTTNDPTLWANMDFLIADCKTNGIFVLMDISAWKKLLDYQGLSETDTNNWLAFIDFISVKYKNEPGIAFWSIMGEPAVPTNSADADGLVQFYDTLTTRLYNNDTNHLICAGGFNHMNQNTSLNWWPRIYALPHNDINAYKTYSQNDLNLTPQIGPVAQSNNKILINEEFGMPQYMGDGQWSGSNYNSIATSVSAFYTNVYNAGLAAGASGFQFWNLDNYPGGQNYDIWPTYMPVTWGTIQRYSPPPQPPLNQTATVINAGETDLSWAKSPEANVTGYNIYRSTTNGFTPVPANRIVTGLTTNYYVDTAGTTPGTTNYYLVTAVNVLGHESSVSAQSTSPVPTSGLFLYEGFEYPAGGLTNNSGGGLGWTDASWSDPANAPWLPSKTMSNQRPNPSILTPGLGYQGLTAAGNAVGTAGGSALRAWNATGTGLFTNAGNTIWFSCLFSPSGTPNNNIRITPFANATAAQDYTLGAGIYIACAGSASTWTVRPYLQTGANGTTYSTSQSSLGLAPSGTSLIVARFNYNGGTTSHLVDTIRVWVNPNPSVLPQDSDTNSVISGGGSLDQGNWFMFRYGSSFTGTLDELRIGGSYADVVPVPGPVTLSCQPSGTNLQLSWSQGTLLEATNLSGPWMTNSASSPYTAPPAGPAKFFRVRVR